VHDLDDAQTARDAVKLWKTAKSLPASFEPSDGLHEWLIRATRLRQGHERERDSTLRAPQLDTFTYLSREPARAMLRARRATAVAAVEVHPRRKPVPIAHDRDRSAAQRDADRTRVSTARGEAHEPAHRASSLRSALSARPLVGHRRAPGRGDELGQAAQLLAASVMVGYILGWRDGKLLPLAMRSVGCFFRFQGRRFAGAIRSTAHALS
jgi:hypothetical protein